MENLLISDASQGDFPRIVKLNDAAVQYTSPMDLERLVFLNSLASYHRVVRIDGQIAAFMFAMRDGAQYVTDNFSWFTARLVNFLYIDRIVVAPQFAGRKIGSAMYRDLFDFARTQQIANVVCEYNVEPPNPVSQAFHAKWGFTELGSQWLNGGAKRVSMQCAAVG
jgi:predicted GNAT superfamily acetyltransferase